MTTKVTKESLERKIASLEKQREFVYFPPSLSEEYQLEAYKMLLEYLRSCSHIWVRSPEIGGFRCEKCGLNWSGKEKPAP